MEEIKKSPTWREKKETTYTSKRYSVGGGADDRILREKETGGHLDEPDCIEALQKLKCGREKVKKGMDGGKEIREKRGQIKPEGRKRDYDSLIRKG